MAAQVYRERVLDGCLLRAFGLKSRDMRAIDHEVASQPEMWRRAIELGPGAQLPQSGRRLAVAGCGTSLFIAQAYAVAREAAGAGETDAWPASEFPCDRRYEALLVLSRSGTTTEVLDLLRSDHAIPETYAITGVPASPLAELAGTTVALPFADERSVVQTRFATTALVLLLAHAGIDLSASVSAAERVLTEPLPLDPPRFRRFQFLGTGWTVGLASEAALKLREAARAWAESYPAMEYRHGPIALADPDTAVIAFGPLDPSLAEQIAATGATLLIPEPAAPLAALTLAHRLAIALAEAGDLDPDAPRNLTRSVVLS
jgi:fructoselysine-6-P-deglycase FrlB-like protein